MIKYNCKKKGIKIMKKNFKKITTKLENKINKTLKHYNVESCVDVQGINLLKTMTITLLFFDDCYKGTGKEIEDKKLFMGQCLQRYYLIAHGSPHLTR